MINVKSGVTALALTLGAVNSESLASSTEGTPTNEKQTAPVVESTRSSEWLAWTTGCIATLATVGAAAAVVRAELRSNSTGTDSADLTDKVPGPELSAAGPFVESLLKLIPQGLEGDEMRDVLTLKKLQLEGGWVRWDWRPGLKMIIESLLPEEPSQMTLWQKEIRDRVSVLPLHPENGLPEL